MLCLCLLLTTGSLIGHVAGDTGDTGWRLAGEAGDTILQRRPLACEDIFPKEVGSGPAVVLQAIPQNQRRHFEREALLKRYGKKRIQAAHPSYHILGEGNVESTRRLSDFIDEMSWLDATNASFVFDGDVGIGQSLKLKGLPSELSSNSKRVFSLGGDGAGLGLHTHGATFLALIHGQKLWLVAPPTAKLAPELHDPVHGHGVRLKLGVDFIDESWVTSGVKKPPDSPFSSVNQCLQSAGSAFYLPANWFHATVNVGDAVAIGVQSFVRPNVFEDMAAKGEIPDAAFDIAVASASVDELLVGLLSLRDPQRGLRIARRALALEPRDLRPHFFIAEILATALDDVKGAKEQMEKCRKEAVALAHAAEPPIPQLAALWLLRVAYTLCEPLQDYMLGAQVAKEALNWDPEALTGHTLRDRLENCLKHAAAHGRSEL